MTCKRTASLLQLYVDDRLAPAQVARLERHLAGCGNCREELALFECIRDGAGESELIEEPADLTQRVLDRVAAFESRRAAAAQEWLPGVSGLAASWRKVALALVALVALALLPSGNAFALTDTLSRHVASAYILLLTPGPDSISWGVWAAGGLVAGAFTIWFARADASSGWRRAISQRLPQLW